MGYYTQIEGTLCVTPPFDGAKAEFINTFVSGLSVDESGDLIPEWEEPSKYYGILKEVQDIIDENPDRKFTGHFECHGTERDDIWRLIIKGRVATKVKARIVWNY